MTGSRFLFSLTFLGAISFFLTGCPQPQGPTRVIALFTSDGNVTKSLVSQVLEGSNKADVPVDDIQSLVVTITGIMLDLQADSGVNSVSVFAGATDVNLLDLQGISEIISEAEVPAGTYEKIRIAFSDPRLVLTSDPSTVLTDIQLTANGNLFVSQTFEVSAGQTSIILLDFGGVKLVEQGNGSFTLTPQLRVDLSVFDADVVLSGDVISVDSNAKTLQLAAADGEVTVDYSAATIYWVNDTDTPTGIDGDLLVGISLQIEGTVHFNGSVTAATIHVTST